MKSNIVFHITEETIKFLQVSSVPKKQVTAVGVLDISNQNDAEIIGALTGFIKRQKLNFAESNVTLLLPRSRVIVRYMVFPSQKKDEIRSMIDLQVGSQIPYSREEVEIDFQVLSKTTDGYSKVAVFIVPQEVVMRCWKVFRDSRVPVRNITISSIGLCLFYQQFGLSDKVSAVFDLDINSSEICICDKDQWLVSREVPVGFEQMQQKGYAEILHQWELTQDNADKLAAGVESVYLISSAKRGDLLEFEMLKLQDNLNIKEIIVPKILSVARGVQWPESIIRDGVSIASLAGIAFSSQIIPVDLTPRAVKKAQEQSIYYRQLIILGVWITIGLISLGFALGMGFFRKNIQLSRLEGQLRDTKHLAFKVEDRLQKIKDIEGMIKGRLIFSDLFRELNHVLPTSIYLVNISITDGNTLSLEGISPSPTEINQFQGQMVGWPSFSNVSLDYVNKRITQQGEVDYFKITCTLNHKRSK